MHFFNLYLGSKSALEHQLSLIKQLNKMKKQSHLIKKNSLMAFPFLIIYSENYDTGEFYSIGKCH